MTTIHLPAEWEPQQALLLTWPHPATDWAAQLPDVITLYVTLTALVTRYQPVLIVCRDDNHRRGVANRLLDANLAGAPIQLARTPYNDTWIRDYGPLTVLTADGHAQLRDFRFNGWGGKFAAGLDDRCVARLYQSGVFGGVPLETSALVLEGGAVETDGQGSMLLVEHTVLDPARNPGWERPAIEAELTRMVGSTRHLWLEHGGLCGDDTDGHIDTLARFTDSGTICHAWNTVDGDADAVMLRQLAAELQSLRQADGAPYRLVPLPQPRPIYASDGRRLPATYVNFIVLNDAVIVPIYHDPADMIACDRLAQVFPHRTIHPLDARALIEQGGSLHCISMHLPAPLPLRALALADAAR